MMRSGVWGGAGKRDLFGLWEVSMPGGKEKFGRGVRGDLEAGVGVGEGDKRVEVVRLCVCPKHRDGEKGSDPKTGAASSSNVGSIPRAGPSRSGNIHTTATNTTSPSSPPIPSISIQTSPIQTTEQAELTKVFLPPPPTTRRSSMRSRPHSRVYTQNIQLDTLNPNGTRPEKRKEKTLSLQLRDMPEIENPRDRRTRSMQEVEDDIFIIGEDDDD